MYISYVEDGEIQCVWVQLKLENLLRAHIYKKTSEQMKSEALFRC